MASLPIAPVTPPIKPPFINDFETSKTAEIKPDNIYLDTYNGLDENNKKTFLKKTYITVIMPIQPEGPGYTTAAKQLFNVIVDNNADADLNGDLDLSSIGEGLVKSQNVEIYKKTRTSTVLENSAKDYKKNVLYKFNVLHLSFLSVDFNIF